MHDHEPSSRRDRAAAVTKYLCPMHPEVEGIEPGVGPKCGMALGLATVTTDDGPNPE
ncbi:MAG: heavy metal-binding domain-containing protein [Thermoanaerobaculia bacterium]